MERRLPKPSRLRWLCHSLEGGGIERPALRTPKGRPDRPRSRREKGADSAISPPVRTPPACPGDALRSSLPAGQSPPSPECPRLARWMLYARRYPPANFLLARMPPACPVDAYAGRYPPANLSLALIPRLARWMLTLVATRRPISPSLKCPRLARWMLTLVATRRPISSRSNAAGLSGGCPRPPLAAGVPPRPVAAPVTIALFFSFSFFTFCRPLSRVVVRANAFRLGPALVLTAVAFRPMRPR